MQISELDANSKKINLEAKVIEKEQVRDVNTKFGQTKVCNVVIEDESGSMILVLWGDEVDKVNQGDKIKIENGYVKEWNGSLQLNVGKYGKMEVVKD